MSSGDLRLGGTVAQSVQLCSMINLESSRKDSIEGPLPFVCGPPRATYL